MADIPDDIFMTKPQKPRKEKVVMMTAEGTEDQEFFYPYYRFIEEGYQVDVITPAGGAFKGKNGAGLKDSYTIKDRKTDDYALLYIPGGKAPEQLKKSEDAVAFVQEFCKTGKPVGAICHGAQILAKAGVVDGEKIAAWPECEKEVEEAGAEYVSEACCQSGQFITGRWPADLPHQMAAVLEALSSSDTRIQTQDAA